MVIQAVDFVVSMAAGLSAVVLCSLPLPTQARLALGCLLLVAALALGDSAGWARGWQGVGRDALWLALVGGGGIQVYVALVELAARVWGEGVARTVRSPLFGAVFQTVLLAGVGFTMWLEPSGRRAGTSDWIFLALFGATALMSWLEAVRGRWGRVRR